MMRTRQDAAAALRDLAEHPDGMWMSGIAECIGISRVCGSRETVRALADLLDGGGEVDTVSPYDLLPERERRVLDMWRRSEQPCGCVTVPPVRPFAGVAADKANALKVLEEAAEVFGAWQGLDRCSRPFTDVDGHTADALVGLRASLIDECADVIQATCNLLAAFGVTDMSGAMAECERRNRERGRY